MTAILGIDPGATTGWCLYDTANGVAIVSGHCPGLLPSPEFLAARARATITVIEKPEAYGPTRPEVVECAWIAGHLAQRYFAVPVTRREVKQILSLATSKDVRVTDDASAWAALKLLHGKDCDKKGGKLFGVKSHARAALAVAVAWEIRRLAGEKQGREP